MQYYALISSLPMLTLEGKVPITEEQFLSACSSYVKGDAFRILEELDLDPEIGQFSIRSLAGQFAAWECALRNAIVKIRANRTERDAVPYLNKEAGVEADTERAVAAAWAVSNPLERERILDRARWMKLEELESGKQFTFEQVCAYKLKLRICLKWQNRNPETGAENLELAAAAVSRSLEMKTKQEN